MESRQFRRGVMLLTALVTLSLTGCVSQPDPDQLRKRLDRLSIGMTIEQVGKEFDASMRRPSFALQSSGSDLVVFAVNLDGEIGGGLDSSSTGLVFDRGQYIGDLFDGSSALGYAKCLRQIGGRDLLAQRLRALCADQPDPLGQALPENGITRGDYECPTPTPPPVPPTPVPTRPAQPSSQSDTGFVRGAGEVAFYTLGVILSPILLPAAGVGLAGGLAVDAPSMGAQGELTLGMSGADFAQLMGKPTMTFVLEPVRVEVRCFQRIIRGELCVGLEQDRVVWFGSGTLAGDEYRKRRVWK